ncbi:hypothetical protein VIGAN_10017200, partial [Vigna angularis var. angularis]
PSLHLQASHGFLSLLKTFQLFSSFNLQLLQRRTEHPSRETATSISYYCQTQKLLGIWLKHLKNLLTSFVAKKNEVKLLREINFPILGGKLDNLWQSLKDSF